MKSIRNSVIDLLHGLPPLTAIEIAGVLDEKLSSVSSVLKKMVDNKTLKRRKGVGPRGGYGYRLS